MQVDERSDEAVYAAHATEMVRFATGLVGPADAPDVAADAFVRVSASPVWRDARDRRTLWFKATAFEARSFMRSARRRRALERKVVLAPSSGGDTSEPEANVVKALDRLSTKQRTMLGD